jgi:hypothetical protein
MASLYSSETIRFKLPFALQQEGVGLLDPRRPLRDGVRAKLFRSVSGVNHTSMYWSKYQLSLHPRAHPPTPFPSDGAGGITIYSKETHVSQEHENGAIPQCSPIVYPQTFLSNADSILQLLSLDCLIHTSARPYFRSALSCEHNTSFVLHDRTRNLYLTQDKLPFLADFLLRPFPVDLLPF